LKHVLSSFTVLFSSFFPLYFVFNFFNCFSIVRYNTFSFVSINLLSQANKRQKSFRKKNVETLSESFTSRGKGTPSISGDRKRTKPKRQKPIEYKDVAQARDYPKSTKTETNRTASTLPPLHGRPLAAQRGRPRLQRFSTKQTTTATVICPRFCPASKRETQGIKRTENEHGSSKHATSRQQFANLTPKSAPKPAFRSLTNHSNYSKNPRFHCPTSVE
jgi:hypothetical protein